METTASPGAVAPRAPGASHPAARRLLTIKNTELALDCSRSTVLRMINDGKLRTVYLSPRAVRVLAADVDALLG